MRCHTKEVYLVIATSLIISFISVLISLGGITQGWIKVSFDQYFPHSSTHYIHHTWQVGMLQYSDSSQSQTTTQFLPGDIIGFGIAILVGMIISAVLIPLSFVTLFWRFNPLTPGSIPLQPETCSTYLVLFFTLTIGTILVTVVSLFPATLSDYFDSNSDKYKHVHISLSWAWAFAFLATILVMLACCLLNQASHTRSCQEPVRGEYSPLNDYERLDTSD